MSIKAEELIAIICMKLGIPRESNKTQFLSKSELLLILAHIEKQDMHMKSMKAEIDDWRLKGSIINSMAESVRKEAEEN